MHMRVLLFRVFFVITLYIILDVQFFLVMGEKILFSLTPFAYLSMFRLPKPYYALRSQHLLSQMHSLSIIPAFHAGAFSKKALLLRFPFPCSYPIPLGLKTKEEPRNTQRTPNHLKVLFIKIGYLKEIFVTVCIGYLPPMPNTSVNFLYTPL